jgi:hypothetical protein
MLNPVWLHLVVHVLLLLRSQLITVIFVFVLLRLVTHGADLASCFGTHGIELFDAASCLGTFMSNIERFVDAPVLCGLEVARDIGEIIITVMRRGYR